MWQNFTLPATVDDLTAASGGVPGVVSGAIVLVFLLVAASTRELFNVEKQFTFYASYHDHPVNQWIHFMCIWPIMWTSLVFFAGTRPVLPLPESAAMLADLGVEFDWAFIISVIYATYYILLEKRLAGVVGAAMVMACCVTASYFAKEGESYLGVEPWRVALVVNVSAWIGQFLGHGIWERRAPALRDNFTQAFLMAPIFVLLEFFFRFGYRREMRERVSTKVALNIAEFRQASKAKAA